MIKLLQADDYIAMPWKNGAGVTKEVVKVIKQGAADFLWRISIADIKEDGQFSTFEGYQRIISVLDGEGMVLNADGVSSRPLLQFDPFAFSGESKVSCHLLKGALIDFNLIYNPDLMVANLQWIIAEQAIRLFNSDDDIVLFNAGKKMTINILGEDIVLEHYDSLWVTQQSGLKELYVTSVDGCLECCLIGVSAKK